MNRTHCLIFVLGICVSHAHAELVTFRTDSLLSEFAFTFGVNGSYSNSQQFCTGCTADVRTTLEPLTLQYDTVTQQVRFVNTTASFHDSGLAVGYFGGFPTPNPFPPPTSADVGGVSITPNSFWYYAVRNSGLSLADDWFNLGTDTLPISYTGGTLEHNFLSYVLVPGGAGGGGTPPLPTTLAARTVQSQIDPPPAIDSLMHLQISLPNIAVTTPLFGNPGGTGIVQVGSASGTGSGTLTLVAHPCTLAGDYDCSGAVGSGDLAVWQGEYGGNDASPAADGDGDGDVDGRDFLLWQRNHANPGLTLNTVPEPTTIVLLSFCAMAIIARCQRGNSLRNG